MAKAAKARLARLQATKRATALPVCPDPVVFARDWLGIEPWSKQIEILHAVRDNARVTVRSGHKVSKSNSAAAIALWWWATKPRGRVIMTAPTARQVKEILWKELRFLYKNAKRRLGADEWLHEAPDSGLVSPDDRQILGFSTNEPERMAGISGAHLLFIIDEASGVPEAIFEAIEGNRAGGAHIVLFSNPTQTVGTFYESHTTKRAGWKPLHISSEHSPNVTDERSIPGLATKEWIEEKRGEWGEESAFYQVRVKGNFPTQSENQVIGLGLVERATMHHEPLADYDGVLEFGVDVARFGDDETVIYPRRGKRLGAAKVLQSMDGPDIAGHVLLMIREMRRERVDDDGTIKLERPRVKVDVIGVGASVFDTLMRHQDECEPIAINVSESPTDETYSKLRDQLWFAARDWLKDGGTLAPDSKLESELVAPKYSFDARSKIKVQSKDEIKETLKRSPDRADALCLAVYNPPVAYVGNVDVDWMSR